MDILTKIVANRTIVIEQERLDPVENWRNPLPKALNVLDRVRLSQPIAVMAEYKKASPSKGIINDKVTPEEQALAYAKGGCAVISCLTEPKWFKGSMDYLTRIRKAIDGLPNRPAVLLKVIT